MHWKKSLLVIQKILRLFVNTLTVNDKHYLLNRDNLTQLIQMQLTEKQKTFCELFFPFLKSLLSFKYFPKKDDRRSWSISGNTGSEKYAEINVSKVLLQSTLRQKTRPMGPNTVAIWITPPLQYLLITVKVVALEKVSFSDTQNPKAVC